jgi:hypothetical protein
VPGKDRAVPGKGWRVPGKGWAMPKLNPFLRGFVSQCSFSCRVVLHLKLIDWLIDEVISA